MKETSADIKQKRDHSDDLKRGRDLFDTNGQTTRSFEKTWKLRDLDVIINQKKNNLTVGISLSFWVIQMVHGQRKMNIEKHPIHLRNVILLLREEGVGVWLIGAWSGGRIVGINFLTAIVEWMYQWDVITRKTQSNSSTTSSYSCIYNCRERKNCYSISQQNNKKPTKYMVETPYRHLSLVASLSSRQPNCERQTKLQMSNEGNYDMWDFHCQKVRKHLGTETDKRDQKVSPFSLVNQI